MKEDRNEPYQEGTRKRQIPVKIVPRAFSIVGLAVVGAIVLIVYSFLVVVSVKPGMIVQPRPGCKMSKI